MTDIPLIKAVFMWTPANDAGEPAFEVQEIYHVNQKKYPLTDGACSSYWSAIGDEDRLLRLMTMAWEITAFWNVPASIVKEELLKIPEYRAQIDIGFLPKQFHHEREL